MVALENFDGGTPTLLLDACARSWLALKCSSHEIETSPSAQTIDVLPTLLPAFTQEVNAAWPS
jgi:hypothetical protein